MCNERKDKPLFHQEHRLALSDIKADQTYGSQNELIYFLCVLTQNYS